MTGTEQDQPTDRPMLRVVSGSPTDDELAAVVAVIAAASAATAPSGSRDFSLWSRKSRLMRPALRPGFGAWRGSMMPR